MELIKYNDSVQLETKDEYERLLDQYNALPEKEKKALIIYKSALFLFISRIMQVRDFDNLDIGTIYTQLKEQEKFSELPELLDQLLNKTAIGKNLATNENFSFMESVSTVYPNNPDEALKVLIQELIPVSKDLKNLFHNMTLHNDIEVYRGTKGEEEDGKIATSPIVSTTLFKSTAFSFIHDDNFDSFGNLGNIYRLKIKKGTPVLVCPFGFYRGNLVKSNQFEIMFLNDDVIPIVCNQKKEKTFFSYGPIDLTIELLEGVVYPKNFSFNESEIKQDINEINPNLDVTTIQEITNYIAEKTTGFENKMGEINRKTM